MILFPAVTIALIVLLTSIICRGLAAASRALFDKPHAEVAAAVSLARTLPMTSSR